MPASLMISNPVLASCPGCASVLRRGLLITDRRDSPRDRSDKFHDIKAYLIPVGAQVFAGSAASTCNLPVQALRAANVRAATARNGVG